MREVQIARNCVLVGLWGGIVRRECKGGGKCRLQEIVYWWDCGGVNCKGKEVQTARNCVLVGFGRVNCKAGGKCRLQENVYWWDCGWRILRGREVQTAKNCVLMGLWGRIVRRNGSAACKKLCTVGIVGWIVMGRDVQNARNCVLVGLWGGEL